MGSIDTSNPKLEISPPNIFRIEFSKEYMDIFAQPTFIISNPTRKTVVIRGMCMEVRYAEDANSTYQISEKTCEANDGKSIMVLYWTHIAKFDWDNERHISVYKEWVSDALPFPVSISNPQTPMAAFVSGVPEEDERKLEPNRCYRATIYALSSSQKDLLQTSFDFILTEDNLKGLNSYPIKPPFYGQHVTLSALLTGRNCFISSMP